MQKKKDPPVWGETDEKKGFVALVSGTHAATSIRLKKGERYFIPENKAGREVFKPYSPPPKEKEKKKEDR